MYFLVASLTLALALTAVAPVRQVRLRPRIGGPATATAKPMEALWQIDSGLR